MITSRKADDSGRLLSLKKNELTIRNEVTQPLSKEGKTQCIIENLIHE